MLGWMSLLPDQRRTCNQLPPMTSNDLGAGESTSLGSDQSIEGSFIHSHMTLSQLSLSRVDPRATDSALSVLLTTRGIFFDDHAAGHITVLTFSSNFPSVVKMIVACRVALPLPVSNEASENAQKVTWFSQIGTTIMDTGWDFTSKRTLLAVRRCSTLPQFTTDWSSPTLAEMSGRVWIEAYRRLPQICRSCWVSNAVRELWGSCWRNFRISTGEILWMYESWFISMDASSHWKYLTPQNSNSPSL